MENGSCVPQISVMPWSNLISANTRPLFGTIFPTEDAGALRARVCRMCSAYCRSRRAARPPAQGHLSPVYLLNYAAEAWIVSISKCLLHFGEDLWWVKEVPGHKWKKWNIWSLVTFNKTYSLWFILSREQGGHWSVALLCTNKTSLSLSVTCSWARYQLLPLAVEWDVHRGKQWSEQSASTASSPSRLRIFREGKENECAC